MLEAGRAEERYVVTRDVLGHASVGVLMTRDPVKPMEPLAQVAADVRGTARQTGYPVVRWERVVGLLPLHVLAATPLASGRRAPSPSA